MGNSLYKAGLSNAISLAKEKKIKNLGQWNSPGADSENSYIDKNGISAFGKWHLGVDENADKETKGAYKYIFTSDFENVDRAGLIAIRQRAGQQNDEEIFNAAGKVLDIIDGKSLDDENIENKIFEIKAEKVGTNAGEKSIIHWISTKDIDRGGEIVDPAGMDDGDFNKSPAVWYNHNYVWNPNAIPVGKSLWRKIESTGVKAKTQFANHQFAQDIYNLHAGDFMATWSIGFIINRKMSNATTFDTEKGILYINHWTLLEYSSAPIAMNPNAMDEVKSIIKSDTAKYIINSMEIKDNFQKKISEMNAEVNLLKENYTNLKTLIDSKDTFNLESMQKDILELRNIIKKQEDEIISNVDPKPEGLVNMPQEEFAKLFRAAIDREFRRMRGRE